MVKSIQIKIITIFMVLGMVVINGFGFYFISELNTIDYIVKQNQDISAVQNEIIIQKENTRSMICGALVIFTFMIIFLAVYIDKKIISPVSRLKKSAELISKGESVEIDYINKSKRKNEIDELVQAFGIMNNGLKENLSELSKQKKQIETILLHMTDGIVAFNADGDLIHINLAAKRMLNINDEKTFASIFNKIDIDINLEKIIYLENWTSSEKKVNISNDQSVNLFFAPFKDENDKPAGVIVVIQDITEQVKLDNMRKEFVANVSHELKTPITSIMGYSETLIENDVDENNQKKFLERISSEAKRMSKLVSDLLILSKYDTAKMKIEKTEFDLGELVKDVFEIQSIEIKNKNIKSECYITSDVPLVYADKGGIERVIINILSNAIKYTDSGGSVTIYVGFLYNDAYIKVKDTGKGIPAADLDKIYERFYRVDKARTREMGGTGLGLSIAKEILDQNDCTIDIKSELGVGTDVIIRIPTKEKKGEN